jgi:hypothetical protein
MQAGHASSGLPAFATLRHSVHRFSNQNKNNYKFNFRLAILLPKIWFLMGNFTKKMKMNASLLGLVLDSNLVFED